jgi:hypothetical protein
MQQVTQLTQLTNFENSSLNYFATQFTMRAEKGHHHKPNATDAMDSTPG